MFEIDKKHLGTFIAELRKEKGYTQKELAERLFVSDKAVSKWETGASIPDTCLLIPLADLLGVTVTELLTYQRMSAGSSMDTEKVEDILKAAIIHSDSKQTDMRLYNRRWVMTYLLCLFISCAEMILSYVKGYWTENLLVFMGLCVGFGAYFCIFARIKLPTYYDENRIHVYSDGILRMNVPGVAFNNSNWPHILHALRIWAVVSMVFYPLLSFLMAALLPVSWQYWCNFALLFVTLFGMFVPIYVAGKKYE